MSKIQQVKKNFYRPNWWLQTALPQARSKALVKSSQLYYSPDENPIKIMNEDWDNLILLDGCRYDLFKKADLFSGQVESRISPGSSTPEFLTHNFSGNSHLDTVYVTANPMYRTHELEDVFYTVIDVWDDHWDNEKRTVLPENMYSATKDAYERFPNKRIFSHFMQPHYPFIGELADELGEHSGYEYAYRQVTEGEASRDYPTVWEKLEAGEVEKNLVWDAYLENLEVATPHIKKLVDHFDNQTVITSDHGNLLGENPVPFMSSVYGHPTGVRHDGLCKVPWVVIEGTTRKQIIEGDSHMGTNTTSDKVTDRLADLGYMDI